MKVAIVIRSLEAGGAERQLIVLAKGLVEKGHEVHVISFYDLGVLENELDGLEIKRATLNKSGRWDILGTARRLARLVNDAGVDVVYSSMPAANLMSVLAVGFGARQPLVWRLAASDMDLSEYDWFSAASYRLEAACSKVPKIIVANSRAVRNAAAARRYPEAKLKVVLNGIDTNVFVPDPEKGSGIAKRWGIDTRKWLIGLVARGDPKKGHGDFLEAVGLLCQYRSDVEFACIGVGSSEYARRLRDEAWCRGVAEKITWRGFEKEVVAVYNALDINTLPSRFGEGFPNSIGEAMACGVPCVVTDTGDSAAIVGDTGEVVPRCSPEDLMHGWMRMLTRLENQERVIKERARQRIVDNFGVDSYVDRSEALLLDVVK